MKRYFYYVVAGILALCAASCTTNELDGKIEGNNTLPNELPNELYVTIDNGEGDTRIQLNEECKTVWTEDDMVSVFYRSDANNKFLFMGDTGDRSGALVVEENRMADATAQIDKVVLLYPYSDNYKLNATTKSVAVQIPGTQYYQNGSYGVGANLMASVGTSNDFALKSVCGWIEIKLTGAASVTSVTLTGNDKEQLAGDATLYYEDLRLALLGEDGGPDDSSQVGGSLFFGEYVRTITLDCGEGVALDSTTPTSFYFVLAPQTFDEGITIKATLSDGTTITKSTTKSLTISRNTIRPMAAFDVQPTDEIWYTSTDGNIVEPYREGVDVFGANIVSNTYANGKGVIKFDGDVTEIGGNAFHNCSTLESFEIPDKATTIGGGAFQNCPSLISISIPASVAEIGESWLNRSHNVAEFRSSLASADGRCLIINNRLVGFAPAGIAEYTIPDEVTSIGTHTFFQCPELTSITIPNNVTKIEQHAFHSCTGLTDVNFGENVKTIESYAFAQCYELSSISLPQNLTTIGDSAFFGTGLTSIAIPNSIEKLGVNPFVSCSKLEKIEGKFASADGRCLINDGKLISFAPAGLTEYSIPTGVTAIGDMAFAYCSSLTLPTIPEGVTTIGHAAFYACAMPEDESLVIPSSVTYIGSQAFDYIFGWDGSNLYANQVYCLATTPPTIGDDMNIEIGVGNCFIVVPAASVEAYKQSDWNNLYNVTIVGDDAIETSLYGKETLTFLKAIVDGNMLGDQTPTITDWTDLSQVVFPGIVINKMIDGKLEIVRIDELEHNLIDLPDVMDLPELTWIWIRNNTNLAGKELPQEWNTPKLEYCNFSNCGLIGTIPEGLASTTPNMHSLYLDDNKFYGALPHYWASGTNGGSGKLECVYLSGQPNKTTSTTLPIVYENQNPGLGYMVPATFDVRFNFIAEDGTIQNTEENGYGQRDVTHIKLGGVFEQNYIGFEKGWGQERYVKYGGGADDDLTTWNDHRLLIDEWQWFFSNFGYVSGFYDASATTEWVQPIPHVMLDWDQAAADAYTAEAAQKWGPTAQ